MYISLTLCSTKFPTERTLSRQDNVFMLNKEWGGQYGQQCARFQLHEKRNKSRKLGKG